MPSMLKLTPVHFAIYESIVAFKQDHDGVAPTVLEIKKVCGINSTSAVRHYLNSLVLFGMIEWEGEERMISIPGARWMPPLNDEIYSPLKRADRVPSVSYTAE
jgi:hypothetical protein